MRRLVVGGELPAGESPHMKLVGMKFDELDVHELSDGFEPCKPLPLLRWLKRDPHEVLLAEMVEFDQEPYQAVENWLRERGRTDDADHVYLAMRRRELDLHLLTVPQRLWRLRRREPWIVTLRNVFEVAFEKPPLGLLYVLLSPLFFLIFLLLWPFESRSMNFARWLLACPLVPFKDKPKLPQGWLRWGVNWFLLRTVGFGVRTRTATIAGILAFLFSWLCVFNTPESAEFKGSRRIRLSSWPGRQGRKAVQGVSRERPQALHEGLPARHRADVWHRGRGDMGV